MKNDSSTQPSINATPNYRCDLIHINGFEITGSPMSHSGRTKAGIMKAKAAGTKWGRHGSTLAKQNKATAQKFAENLRSLILELMLSAGSRKGRGPTALAEKLNALGEPTAREGNWHPATVCRLMKRLEPSLSQSYKKINNANGEKFLKENLDPGIAGHIRHADRGM